MSQLPLCEQGEVTVFLMNDSAACVSYQGKVAANNYQWVNFGMIDPQNSITMYRPAGEEWRLLSYEKNPRVLAIGETVSGSKTLHVRAGRQAHNPDPHNFGHLKYSMPANWQAGSMWQSPKNTAGQYANLF